MDLRYEERRKAFKSGVDAARQRREEAFAEQNQNRADLVSQMRMMAFAELNKQEDEVVDVQMMSRKSKRKQKKFLRWQYFARQFMISDWFIDVPEKLETEWFVSVRPEGDRCMLFSASGRTTLQRKNGRSCKKFFDDRFPKGETILDGVRVGTQFVCTDVLMWGGLELMDAQFQCRHFFLQSRLSENAWEMGDFTISQVDADLATCDNLEKLYASACQRNLGFEPDGFHFIHQDAQYTAGLSPLALAWRDYSISRFAVDNMIDGNILPQDEVCILRLRKGNHLRTEDRYIVATLQPEELQGIVVKSLVKCRIVNWVQGKDFTLEVIGKAGPTRVFADSWSRLRAQHGLRVAHSTYAPRQLFDQLLTLVRQSTQSGMVDR